MTFKFHRQFYNKITVLMDKETLIVIYKLIPKKEDRTLEQQELYDDIKYVARQMKWDIE